MASTGASTLIAEQPRKQAPGGRLAAERFEVLEEIGRGGMATIFLARDRERPELPVALKVIHPHLAGDAQLIERFKHEVRAHVGLEHPCIVEMLGWGEDARGSLFLAMEFVDGPVVKDLMLRRRRFPVDVAVHVAIGLLRGLHAAHACGIVHRDVKPANVMLTKDGQLKVADFGISKAEGMTQLTSTGNVIGTPAYMSPEQALGKAIDARSDLFSAGVFLYEMLVGSNPFLGDNPATTLQRVVHHHQRPVFESLPQVPSRLETLLESLLDKDAEQRPADAAAAVDELMACVEEEGLAATPEMLAAYLRDSDRVARQLDSRRAQRHYERGLRFYDGGKGTPEGAIWELFLATVLDSSHQEARNWLEQLSTQQGYNLQRRSNERIEELEAELKDDPDQLHVVLQLAKLHKAQGNFLQVIFYYKRAKALRPPDRYTQNQIETLVNARAAPIIEGTGVFETIDHVPVRLRPTAPAEAERIRAEGWGDFLQGLLTSGFGRLAAGAAVLVLFVLAVGSFVESATEASHGASVARPAPSGDPAFDREAGFLHRGQTWADQGDHAKAEEIFRTFLDEYPDSLLRSEVLFRLGDSLERQGRRPEALDLHGDNAGESVDDWALRSQQRRAELFLLDGDKVAARHALRAVTSQADGQRRLEAMLSLADLDRSEGELRIASYAYEALVEETGGTDLHDRARLGLAATQAALGQSESAAELYAEIRDSTDHKSEAFAEATAALERLQAGG